MLDSPAKPTAPTTPPPRAGRRERLGVAALMLPCMLVVMDLSVLFLAVPSLRADLHPSSTELLWITDLYGFLIAGALIVMGTLGDRIGRRRVLLWGSAAFGSASILAACSQSPEMLIVARGIQGIAGATLIPSTMALLFSMFPHQDDRMKAIGHGNHGVVSFVVLAVGVAIGTCFLRRQTRLEQPLLNLTLFRRRTFSVALLSNTLTTFVMFGVFFFVNQYLQLTLGLSPLHAALWSLPGLVAMTAGTMVIVPKLATRHQPGTLMAGGALIMVVVAGLIWTALREGRGAAAGAHAETEGHGPAGGREVAAQA